MNNRTINNWQKAISDVAFDDKLPISKKNKDALVEVLDLLDDLLVQGAVYKD